MQPIALSDYLRTVQGAPRRSRRGSAQDSQGAGEADAGAQTTPQDFSLEGRAQLAQSAIPGITAKAVGVLGLPGTLMGLGINLALGQNENALNRGLENLDEAAVANIMNAPVQHDARFGELSGRPGTFPNPFMSSPKQGLGVDPTDEGPGIAAALADAAAASAASAAAASAATGLGEGAVGGFGDNWDQGGRIASGPRGHVRITAQPGEYVIKRSAVQHYGQSLLDAINRAEADVKVVRKPRDLKTALTTR